VHSGCVLTFCAVEGIFVAPYDKRWLIRTNGKSVTTPNYLYRIQASFCMYVGILYLHIA
jgi:hypothetical protein